jgi:8-oxo-dGTP diphosphatase
MGMDERPAACPERGNPFGGAKTLMMDVTAAILVAEGKVLIARRRPDASQPGLWEFPGGKLEAGESPEECLRRELREELAVEIGVDGPFAESIHPQGGRTIRLLAYRVRLLGGTPRPLEHAEIAWVAPGELERYDFLPADRPLARRLARSAAGAAKP